MTDPGLQRSAHRYLVVEGPIGVGKTSLAQRLGESLRGDTLLEAFDDNPFLERFYANPREGAFPAQLFFLFQRSRQIQRLRQNDLFRERIVSDFMLEKDRLFARLNLDSDELALYDQVYDRLSMEAPSPDLVIYLQAPVDVLLERVHRRGRPVERTLRAEYLARLSEAYTEFFYYYDRSPLLIVNAAEINPVDRDADYAQLLEQVRAINSGRHYFNPSPLLL
ncbi:MAG: deoxynucleoside kinase [Chromatiales bacterium]|jgi:deoxyadenosine/deoxycytidine kinase